MITTALKRVRLERYIFATIMVFIMFAIAEFTHQKEIIFPEILAIMTGAWISELQPWSINKRKMFVLISFSAIVGVLIVKYVHLALFFQVLLSFLFTGLALIMTKTTFIPIISACILPVYLRTTSWVYSISVIIMAVLIVLFQWLMEKYRLRPKNVYVKDEFCMKEEVDRWIKLLLIFSVISILPLETRNIFFLAPPLIVTFAEFANPKSPLRDKPFQIWGLMVFSASVGSILKMVLSLYLHVPILICAMCACVLLFVVFDRINIQFPPAGAILLLPMILNFNDLKFFPIEVAIGCAILIFIAIKFFYKSAKVF